MVEINGGRGGLDYLKSCNKHILPKLSASWDAFLGLFVIIIQTKLKTRI